MQPSEKTTQLPSYTTPIDTDTILVDDVTTGITKKATRSAFLTANTISNPTISGMRSIGGLTDTSGNEIIKTLGTPSAVNEISVFSNRTGGSPIIKASGDDSDIDLVLKSQGTNGRVLLDSGAWIGAAGTTASPTPNVITDVTSSSLTFTLKNASFLIVTYGATLQVNGGATSEIRLNVDSSDTGTGATSAFASNSVASTIQTYTCFRTEKVTLAAGSHTIKLRMIANIASAAVTTNPNWYGMLVSQ